MNSPNHIDYAAASGAVPPHLGKCGRCGRFTEVDDVIFGQNVTQLCAACKSKLRPKQSKEQIPEMPW